MSDYLDKLIITSPARKGIVLSALKTLNPAEGCRVLDAGCGAGFQALTIAEECGTNAKVYGIDISSEFISHAEKICAQAGLSDRVDFIRASVTDIPFEDDTFDFALSMDCVGYGPIDKRKSISELIRTVKSGGKIALLAWSSELLLPGYPNLEADLRSTASGIAPFVRGDDPDSHFMRLPVVMNELGIKNIKAEVFTCGFASPFSVEEERAVDAFLEMRWDLNQVSEETRLRVGSLLSPDSDSYILKNPFYYGFFTYTMFYGEV